MLEGLDKGWQAKGRRGVRGEEKGAREVGGGVLKLIMRYLLKK